MSETAQVIPQAAPQTTSAVEGTVAPTETPETKPDPRLAQLAAQTRRLRQMDKEIKDRELKLAVREAQIEQQIKDKYIPKEELQKNTLGTLQSLGIDYDKLTQEQLINIQSQDPIAAELARQRKVTEELQAKLDAFEKSSTENQTQSYQQALNQISREVKQMVDVDERFEAIKATGSYQDVVKFIETYFKKTNEIIDYEEAAQFIEDDLIEDSVKRAQLKKVQAKLTPTQAAAQAEIPTQKLQKYKRDNGMTATIVPRGDVRATTLNNQIPSTSKPMSARERAILAGKGLLK